MTTLEKMENIRKKTTDELREIAISGRFGHELSELARIELDIRNNKEANEIGIKANEISSKNLLSTKNLVKATWGLVIATAILAIISFVAILLR